MATARKLTIVVDAPDAPSTKIDGEPAWHAQLWEGNKTNGARPDKTKGYQAISIFGPRHAVGFVLDVLARRP